MRDTDGRTYAAATVENADPSLTAVCAARQRSRPRCRAVRASFEAAAVVTAAPDGERAGLGRRARRSAAQHRAVLGGGPRRRRTATATTSSRQSRECTADHARSDCHRRSPHPRRARPWTGARHWIGHDRAAPCPASRCFVGRPNAGKSTLTNALVGDEGRDHLVKPQTTRHAVRGIVHRPDAPADPGRHPGAAPAAHAARRAAQRPGPRRPGPRSTWSAFCCPANEKVGPGDRFIVSELAKVSGRTKVAVVTKTDLADREQIGRAPARRR